MNSTYTLLATFGTLFCSDYLEQSDDSLLFAFAMPHKINASSSNWRVKMHLSFNPMVSSEQKK
jgi:hypothetical protein